MGSELLGQLQRILTMDEDTSENFKATTYYNLKELEDGAYEELRCAQDKLNGIWDLQNKLKEKRKKLLDK